MANELPNAATLLHDPTFRDWILAASIYQARIVITEDPATADHATRLKLANDVIVNPQMTLDRFVNLVATDPDIAGAGNNVTAIGQPAILSKVAQLWTPLAKLLYPGA